MGKLLKRFPIRIHVVTCRIRVTTGTAHDALHHPAFEEAVFTVKECSGNRRGGTWLPTGFFKKLVQTTSRICLLFRVSRSGKADGEERRGLCVQRRTVFGDKRTSSGGCLPPCNGPPAITPSYSSSDCSGRERARSHTSTAHSTSAKVAAIRSTIFVECAKNAETTLVTRDETVPACSGARPETPRLFRHGSGGRRLCWRCAPDVR